MIIKVKTQKILQKDNPILRKVSEIVPEKEIGTKKISKIISEMKKALAKEADGIAISAIQIGYPIRIFLISKKIFDILELPQSESNKVKDLIFINPKINKLSKEKQLLEEGCLSVRYLYGKVLRSAKAHIEATDEKGQKISRGVSGFLSQVVQHENDHLNGILFIDKAVDVVEVLPEKK